MNVIKTKHYHMYIPEGQHSKLDCLWQSEICRGHSQTPAPLEHSDPALHDAFDPNEPPSAFCSIGTKTQGGVKERKKNKKVGKCANMESEQTSPVQAVLTLTSWGWAGRTPPGVWAGWEVGWRRTEASASVRWWPASGPRRVRVDPSTWETRQARTNTVW